MSRARTSKEYPTRNMIAVCTENSNPGVAVMGSA